jgi:heme exporter protein B
MVVSLALGTPVLSLIGAVGAALTLGLRGGGVLTSLLVLPLYIPVLIFGSGAVGAAATSVSYSAYLLLLGAFLLFAIVLTPWLVGIALRISVE